jgi:co-chaperonin GroES (HSP10)
MTTGSITTLPYGTVEQVGPEVEDVKVGEVVLFTEIGAIPLGIKEDHVLIEPEDILAILEEGEY